MRKSLGDKRREVRPDRAQDILKILAAFKDGDARVVAKDGKEEEVVVSKVVPTVHFGFRKITVERPLRLNFQATPERIARLEERGASRRSPSRRRRAPPERRSRPWAGPSRRPSASSSGRFPRPSTRTGTSSRARSRQRRGRAVSR